MTEGIIQEVFDNYLINHNIKPSLLNGLRQELIERIKQFNFDWLPEGRITKIIPKYVLIGDNQE